MAELASTGALAMFCRQGLLAGKGTKPFRLAPVPRSIWLQAEDVGGGTGGVVGSVGVDGDESAGLVGVVPGGVDGSVGVVVGSLGVVDGFDGVVVGSLGVVVGGGVGSVGVVVGSLGVVDGGVAGFGALSFTTL